MQAKITRKIIIDEAKLRLLLRLGLSHKVLFEAIVYGKIEKTNDRDIDELLETFRISKEFENWGGNRNPNGINQHKKVGQLGGQLGGQLDQQDGGQDADRDRDKDKDRDKDRDITSIQPVNNLPQVVEKREKERKEESDFDFFNCGGGGDSHSQEQAPQKKDIAAAISKITNALTRNPDLVCISTDKVIYPQPFKSWIEKQKEFDKITKWLLDKHPGENVSHQLPLSVIAKMRKTSKYVMELAYEDYCVTHSNLT